MSRTANPDLMQAMVNLSAMVFAAKPPEDALQSLAVALDLQTVAILREDLETDGISILAQNRTAILERVQKNDIEQTRFRHCVILGETEVHSDTLVLQTRQREISADQRDAIGAYGPYLAPLWAARSDSFERALKAGRTPASQSVLHPDNPFGLTQTEIRVCGLIASGHRPAAMSHAMKTSMSTVRTHLRSIYAKTGLDGMMGVLRNIQAYADDQKIAG